MKQMDICHWEEIDRCTNLLFFAQLVNELLFDYSIPSNRISTLNCHYLCLDALSAISGIENHGIPEGTLRPIMEELYAELLKDPVFTEKNHPKNYFVKNQEGKYRVVNGIKELNYQELKLTATSLYKVFFEDHMYYNSAKRRIVEIVKNNNSEEQQELFRLTKSILTELMNTGYNLRYLYLVTKQIFWNGDSVVSDPGIIDNFFDYFCLNNQEYTVIFKVKKDKASEMINYLDELSLQTEIDNNEKNNNDVFFHLTDDENFLSLKQKAIDPFSAAEKVKLMLENNTAVYRLYNHDYKYKIWAAPFVVLDDKGRLFKGRKKIKGVQHTKKPSNKQIIESMVVADKAMSAVANDNDYQDLFSLLSAIRFHAHSLDSFSDENQLLDLWAIFETILDISSEHTSDRIQQVCSSLVPLLKKKYLYTLFDQLSSDIKNYDEDMYLRIIGDANDRPTIVQKVCEFVLLPEKSSDRSIELANLYNFPLLRSRICYYERQLSTPKLVYKFVEKHAERVKWQIMRIYRNRNLIIHNGDKMPYLRLLIENLHSYVDDFLSYTIHSLAKGNNINSMCQSVYISECKWNASFSKSNSAITSDEIVLMLSM